MHHDRTPIPETTYRLLELIPYPRGGRAGHLADADGTRLHGAYERTVPGGYRSAMINNGRIFHRYTHTRPSPPAVPGDRHSYANLALFGGRSWGVPSDSILPITNDPATDNPHPYHRPLWDSHFVQQRLVANLKPAGGIFGSPEQVATWCAEAARAGLVARTTASWRNALGQMTVTAQIAHRGPVLVGDERQHLDDAYRGLLPDDVLGGALQELEALTGEDLLWLDLANPVDAQDLIITGHAYGYPPASTIACIFGTHG